MKEKIIIKRGDTVLYQGNILDTPFKEAIIIERSIDIFGDEDPCIVHQSFVVKELVVELIELFEDNNVSIINGSDYLKELDFINFEDIKSLSFELVRRRK